MLYSRLFWENADATSRSNFPTSQGSFLPNKVRTDDYMYHWMDKFNKEFLKLEGTFEQNFYLACLLYPQDLSRNIDIFVKMKKGQKAKKGQWRDVADRVHQTLYKYSHDKLDYFASLPEIAFLFCHFYEKGAGSEINNPKFSEEYEIIRTKWMDTLNP